MISFIITLIVLIIALAIVTYFLGGIWRTVRKFVWIWKWDGIQKRIKTTANELETQVRAFVEQKVREHSLVLKSFLTTEEYEELRQGHNYVTGWVCTVTKDDRRTTRPIEVWIVLRSKCGVECRLPPNRDWSVADQFVFDVNSPRPGSIGIETTSSTNVAEMRPIVERIFAKYGV